MNAHHQSNNSQSFRNQKLGRTIINDIKRGDFKRTLFHDLKEIYHFYLDEDTKERLKGMNFIKRRMFVVWWMLKSMFLKLTPVRRILFVAAVFMMLSVRTTGNNGQTQINVEWVRTEHGQQNTEKI